MIEIIYRNHLQHRYPRKAYHPAGGAALTLGREVDTDSKPCQIEPFGETVTSIELMKSERVGGTLTYTAIYRRSCE